MQILKKIFKKNLGRTPRAVVYAFSRKMFAPYSKSQSTPAVIKQSTARFKSGLTWTNKIFKYRLRCGLLKTDSP